MRCVPGIGTTPEPPTRTECQAILPTLCRVPLTPFEIISLLALGLVAGALGGMLGIGGSIIMIPVLTLLLHRNHHVSQAVAMIVNVFVSFPAVWQHHRADAVRWK